VSAQDEFTKWAKLQRQQDKAMAEYQKLGMYTLATPTHFGIRNQSNTPLSTDNSLKTHRATFQSTVSTLRWLGTQGLRFVLQFWFAKSPMFWLPAGWVPYYVEWILSFPRAPLGSVSINVWGIACASMIVLVGEAVMAAYVLATKKPVGAAMGEKEEPMAFEASRQGKMTFPMGDKKEL
jgi:hypothetical protein